MFRKIIILFLVLSPVLYTLFIGYPVVSGNEFLTRKKEQVGVVSSKRCFHTGDFPEFRHCYAHHEKLAGRDFAEEVLTKTNTISPIVTLLLLISFLTVIILSVSLLFEE